MILLATLYQQLPSVRSADGLLHCLGRKDTRCLHNGLHAAFRAAPSASCAHCSGGCLSSGIKLTGAREENSYTYLESGSV